MSYQKVTGCLSQGAHPGSYNGQDAYNDMLVIDNESKMHGKWATLPNDNGGNIKHAGLYARCPSNSNRERERVWQIVSFAA